MLPWFIYLLLQLGLLMHESEWFTLTLAEQEALEIIITDEVTNP